MGPKRNHAWIVALLISASASVLNAQTITITQGGFYTFQVWNGDPNAYAVRVETTEYVQLYACDITSAGQGTRSGLGGGIWVCPGGSVSIADCNIRSQNPNLYGAQAGWGINAQQPAFLWVHHNAIDGWSIGVWAEGKMGETTDAKVCIQFNRITRTNGAPSNGDYGWLGTTFINSAGQTEDDGGWSHAVCLYCLENDPNLQVAYNDLSNPMASADRIDFYASSGTPEHPAQIFENYIEGPLPNNTQADVCSVAAITMDGPAQTDKVHVCRYVTIENNYIARSGCGPDVWDGVYTTVTGNHVAFDGLDVWGNRYKISGSPEAIFTSILPGQVGTNRSYGNTFATYGAYQPVQGIDEGNTVLSTHSQADEGDLYRAWANLIKAQGYSVGPNL